jgi:hypothetical protein
MTAVVRVDKSWNGKPSGCDPYTVEFSLSPINGDMQIVINAPFFNEPAPPFPRGKVEGLHMYEVVEVFISGFPYTNDVTETPYLEIQVGPHGHYFLAFFMREADWVNQDTSLDFLSPPAIDITHSTKRWHATISIPSYYLPEPQCGDNFAVEWKTNVCAIHGPPGEKQFLSSNRLPGSEPNFHQLASFKPIQLYETLEIRATVDRTKSIVHDKLSLTPPKGGSAFNLTGSSAPAPPPFNVTEELRRAVLEESLLAVEGRMSGSAAGGKENRRMSAIAEEDPSRASDMSQVQSHVASGPAVPPPPPPVPVEQVARQIREKLLRSDIHSSALSDLDEACQRHLLQGEFVIFHSVVWKRRGLSFKKRRLIVTSKPRLLYVTVQGEFKGQITWSMTKRLNIVKRNDKKFDVISPDGGTYHFSDSVIGSTLWIEVLENIMQAQKQYLVASRQA